MSIPTPEKYIKDFEQLPSILLYTIGENKKWI